MYPCSGLDQKRKCRGLARRTGRGSPYSTQDQLQRRLKGWTAGYEEGYLQLQRMKIATALLGAVGEEVQADLIQEIEQAGDEGRDQGAVERHQDTHL